MPKSLYPFLTFLVGLIVVLSAVSDEALAQAGSSTADSLRHYELSEIVVGGGVGSDQPVAEMGAVRRVSLASIVRADAPDVAGLTRLVPSAHLQTNSRGESLVYLRGSGERQVAVFLDGALLNVPWDNRVDLSTLPASILGGLKVTHGAGSVLYGTNVLGGVVNLATRTLDREGSISEATVAGGSAGYFRADGMHIRRTRRTTIVAAAGFNSTDGQPLAGDSELSFGQAGGELRTNTDKDIRHAFVRVSRTGEQFQAGLSLLHVDASKGVAPEGHLDPREERVRYWRYPEWGITMATASVAGPVADQTSVRAAVWASAFRQQIDQYSSDSYADLVGRQDDRDQSVGVRLAVERPVGPGLLRGAINGLRSSHLQVDSEVGICQIAGCAGPGVLVDRPEDRYLQLTSSIGAEYAFSVGNGSRAVLGGNLDRFSAPETAGKPTSGAFSAWGTTASYERDLASGWRLHVSAGRKVRFPTMRELFGTALNRFLVNEDLRPETAWLIDAGVEGDWAHGRVEVTGFVNRTWDTIDQQNLMVGESRLRQRINLEGSRVLGIEFVGDIRTEGSLRVDYAVTLTEPDVLGRSGRSVLTEKPDVLGSIGVSSQIRSKGSIAAEAVYTGTAYGLSPENELVSLPRVVQLNARASLRHYTSSGVFGEVFLRLDNITDRAVVPQLGLPGPGRRIQIGLSLAL